METQTQQPAKLESATKPPIPVTVTNFNRAESDLYFSGLVQSGGFGKFYHYREITPIDKQNVIRMTRPSEAAVAASLVARSTAAARREGNR